jgi:hypothetical protein
MRGRRGPIYRQRADEVILAYLPVFKMRALGAAYSHIVPAFLRVVIVVAALLRMNSVAARRQHRRTRQDGASAIRDPTGRTVNYSAGPDRTGVVRPDRTLEIFAGKVLTNA